jgi:crossover junction endodeoxyribonuclease RuvC
MIILSIDPGVERVGYAILEKDSRTKAINCLHSGLVLTDKTLTREKRFVIIYDRVSKLIDQYRPDCLVIEELFYSKNVKTAIAVAQAQGLLYLAAAAHSISLHSLPPNTIKMRVTGYGNADKLAIKKMVDLQMKLTKKKRIDDEYDAIACGMAYLLG